jgi:4-amino-4-deoxy-L-arabinose transferase-like glycosyltransferase
LDYAASVRLTLSRKADIVATVYSLTGSITPTAARTVSVFFGIMMLAGVFFLCRRWTGTRCAWLSVLVLVSMPKFYYYSHLILLDIAVGAFCTVALVAFAFWLWWADTNVAKRWLLCLFYLASAGAFLSKGMVGVFHIIVVVGVFCLITRQWHTLRRLLFALPIFVFIVPVVTWIIMFYREGGMPYLYEHFVNNVIGRFLKMGFTLSSVHFLNTDLGKTGSWHFYITSLGLIFGAAVVILPLAIWNAAVKIKVRNIGENRNLQTDMWLLLLIWAVVPIFLLSFSAAKETSYIIPSYAAAAILIGALLDERLPEAANVQWRGIGWLTVTAIVAVLSIFLSGIDARKYLFIALAVVSLAIPGLLILLSKKKFTQCCFWIIAAAICAPIIWFSPNVQYDFRKSHCALPLAKEVWSLTGDAPLYLYRPRDILRGSIAFYGGRTVPELDVPEQLRAVLASGQKVFILAEVKKLKPVQADTSLADLYRIRPLTGLGLDAQYVLLTSRQSEISRNSTLEKRLTLQPQARRAVPVPTR